MWVEEFFVVNDIEPPFTSPEDTIEARLGDSLKPSLVPIGLVAEAPNPVVVVLLVGKVLRVVHANALEIRDTQGSLVCEPVGTEGAVNKSHPFHNWILGESERIGHHHGECLAFALQQSANSTFTSNATPSLLLTDPTDATLIDPSLASELGELFHSIDNEFPQTDGERPSGIAVCGDESGCSICRSVHKVPNETCPHPGYEFAFSSMRGNTLTLSHRLS